MDRYFVGALVEEPPSRGFVDEMVRRGTYFGPNRVYVAVAVSPPNLAPMPGVDAGLADPARGPNLCPMREVVRMQDGGGVAGVGEPSENGCTGGDMDE